jgi:aminoglycoside phosphotransferase family enzyme/predicted kinase
MDHVIDSQEPVFALLADPATHGDGSVKRIDTHAAVIFLAGDRVFKVKRAVRFAFLDYSTLDRRRLACEAEIEVNRAFAPDIYRGVVAITREADGRLALDGSGTPVEWAVEMRRFDEKCTLDNLAERGQIEAALADALGRVVAAAHAGAPPVAPGPWIAALGDYIDEHVASFGETPDLFPAAEVDTLARKSRAAYDRIHPLLVERGRQGLIRRIHGDLHLGNIVLLDGRPVLFDAIEFSPLIASGDVLYDLAFLLMDLTERGLGSAANTVFNRYLIATRRTEDLDALSALPFFLSMRAAIRAKVIAARLEQAKAHEQRTIIRDAKKYFDWSRRFIAPVPAMLVAVGGLSGTGKSALARALAAELGPPPGAVVLRSDVERKALFGKDESETLPSAAYTADVTERVYATIVEKVRRTVAAGHSAIVDAVFARPQERAVMEQSATALDVPCHGLFLDADLATRLDRVGQRGQDASDADAAVARAQATFDLGKIDWLRVDAGGTPEETLARAKKAMVG